MLFYCFISGRLYIFELFSFVASYDRPYALKIKYPVTRGGQVLLDVVFACCYMKGSARFVCLLNHCYTSIV